MFKRYDIYAEHYAVDDTILVQTINPDVYVQISKQEIILSRPTPRTSTTRIMTKKNLLDLLSAYPDDSEVVIEVHDTALHEDLYDFTLDPIQWTRFDFNEDSHETMHELRLCPIKNEQ